MKEVDEKVKEELVNELNNAYDEVKSDHEKITMDTTRNVGNNGYAIDQSFTLTGKLKVVKSIELKSAYLAMETKEGVDISLQRLMGISSPKGYIFEGFVINRTNGTGEEGVKVFADVAYTKDKEGNKVFFDFNKCWQPNTRDLYDMAALIRTNSDEFKDKVVTYKGTIVRQITAKKNSKDNGENGWKKDYKRAMTAQLWTME